MRTALLVLAMQMVTGYEPTVRPKLTPQDVARGRMLFQAQCAYCHGSEGDGGRGANLARPTLRHAPDDQALFRVINRGIPGTGMPGNAMSEREVWQVLAFVRSLGRVKREGLPGNPSRGEEVYRSQGCAACHTIRGRGGPTGPDLTDVGARSSAAFLRESLLDPGSAVPVGFMQVRILTRQGKRIEGVRINEDAFSIQIRDMTGALHSFFKDELATLDKDAAKSPMPGYRDRLEPTALDDLVAYLASLEGAR